MQFDKARNVFSLHFAVTLPKCVSPGQEICIQKVLEDCLHH